MKKFLLFFVLLPTIMMAQEEKKFGIHFNGFVKTDVFYDTRNTVDVREGHFLLYPQNENLDPDGKDLNAVPKFHILSIQTRLKGTITGPDALGAKTSGMIEGEFFGTSNSELNGFRLRHAIVKLDWTNTQLLVGQYWHPMFNTNCFPGTVSFNTGAPFEPFSRNPQIRLTQKFGGLKVALTLMSQKDFMSNGPEGASTIYLRQSVTPATNLSLEYGTRNEEKGQEFLVGASVNYKTIQPYATTPQGYKTDEKVSSLSFSGLVKFKCKNLTAKVHGFYGADAYNLTMLGGYAVKDVNDTVKGFMEYVPINNASFWAEVHTNGPKWQFGIFGGYTKNLGSNEEFDGPFFSRGTDIDYIYRISPRVIFNAGKFRIAPELEYTVAAYGNIADKGVVEDAKEIGNFRILLGVYYFF